MFLPLLTVTSRTFTVIFGALLNAKVAFHSEILKNPGYVARFQAIFPGVLGSISPSIEDNLPSHRTGCEQSESWRQTGHLS